METAEAEYRLTAESFSSVSTHTSPPTLTTTACDTYTRIQQKHHVHGRPKSEPLPNYQKIILNCMY